MPKGKIELHTDLLQAWEALNDAEWGRLVRSMLVYRLTGETMRLGGNERSLFCGEKMKIDRQIEAEEKKKIKTRERVTRYRALQLVTERYNALQSVTPPSPSSSPAPSPPSSPPTPPVITPVSPPPVLTPSPKEKPPKGGKKKAPTVEVEGLGFGADLTNAFSDWLQYKQERGEQYKPKGLEMLIARMRKNVEVYGEAEVAELICECMSSNWKGIIWDRLKNKNGGRKGSPMVSGQSAGQGRKSWAELARELEDGKHDH